MRSNGYLAADIAPVTQPTWSLLLQVHCWWFSQRGWGGGSAYTLVHHVSATYAEKGSPAEATASQRAVAALLLMLLLLLTMAMMTTTTTMMQMMMSNQSSAHSLMRLYFGRCRSSALTDNSCAGVTAHTDPCLETYWSQRSTLGKDSEETGGLAKSPISAVCNCL